ncbi:MAG: glycosyltransferase family 39 protein [Anaerolineae bacterium]
MRWRHLLLLAALLLAAALRFYRLDAQSFWNDEGNSARLVERSPALIIKGASADVHPPGYYLLLHGWRIFTGDSEFALRSFSVFCGLLSVALTAALGQRLGGPWTALGAAYALAVHPLALYYSQEARMYGLLGLVSAATLRLAASFWREEGLSLRLGGGLLLVLILGLYTHYAYVFVVLGVNLAFVGLWFLSRPLRWRRLWGWVGCQGLAALAFLPWLPYALRATGWTPPDLNSGPALTAMSRALLVGITFPAEAGAHLLPLAGLLLLLTFVTAARSPFMKGAAWAVAVLPVALIAALNMYRGAYLKFLMAAVTPLTLLLALPLASLGRNEARYRAVGMLAGAILLLGLFPAQVTALRHLYFDPAYGRDDYRGLAAFVEAEARPEDAVILSAPNQWEVFTYYYKGPVTVYPAPYHPEMEKASTWVQEVLAAGHPQLFVLYWGDRESDPHGRLERELAQQAYKATERWVTDVRLARYGVASLPTAPQVRLDARLGDTIRLEGYALVGETFRRQEIVPLTLFWRAETAPGERFKVFVHLWDENGALVAQTDAEPVGGFHPTSRWEADESVLDRYGVLLPADLASGHYTLVTGMYRPGDGTRLTVQGPVEAVDDAVVLETLNVER